jgi:hypothetical protein
LRQLGTKLEWLLPTPLKPSIETTHPDFDTAELGSSQRASVSALERKFSNESERPDLDR